VSKPITKKEMVEHVKNIQIRMLRSWAVYDYNHGSPDALTRRSRRRKLRVNREILKIVEALPTPPPAES